MVDVEYGFVKRGNNMRLSETGRLAVGMKIISRLNEKIVMECTTPKTANGLLCRIKGKTHGRIATLSMTGRL